MMIGGGPKTEVLETVLATLSVAMGGPLIGNGVSYAGLLGGAMLTVGFVSMWKSDRVAAFCNFVIIVLAPAAVLMITEHSLLYPRYFLIPVAFGLLVISEALSRWWSAGRPGRMATLIVCIAYLVGNVWWNVLLLNHGRGDYSHALQWMVEQKEGSSATISSDHDLRNGLMVSYYASRDQLPLQYVAEPAIPREGTDWKIRHTFIGDKPPPQVVTDPSGVAYRLKATFTHHGLTGWNWWVYQRVGRGG
jgi:hypothetical protein